MTLRDAFADGAREDRCGWLLRRRGLLLLLLAVSSQRHWQHHVAALERENLNLQLQELREQIIAQPSPQLADRAGDLAQSDSVAEILPDNAPPGRIARHSHF